MIEWSPGLTLEQIEKTVILQAKRFYNDNNYVVAKALKIDNEYLTKKLRIYELQEIEQIEKDEKRKKIIEDFQLRARGLAPKIEPNTTHSIESINPPLEIYHSTMPSTDKKPSKRQESKVYAE